MGNRRELAVGAALGMVPLHVARVQVYGSRIIRNVNAGDASPTARFAANGIGPRSVWSGPAQSSTRGGAPALKRARIA